MGSISSFASTSQERRTMLSFGMVSETTKVILLSRGWLLPGNSAKGKLENSVLSKFQNGRADRRLLRTLFPTFGSVVLWTRDRAAYSAVVNNLREQSDFFEGLTSREL